MDDETRRRIHEHNAAQLASWGGLSDARREHVAQLWAALSSAERDAERPTQQLASVELRTSC